jgi:hypothetical protein
MWLFANNRQKEAIEIFEKIAKSNKKTVEVLNDLRNLGVNDESNLTRAKKKVIWVI